MDRGIVREVLADQLELIKNFYIIDRPYHFDPSLNYVLVGPRRAGKSVMMYKRVRELIDSGVDWKQIMFINFEDDRLSEFTVNDFNDIVSLHSELTDKKGYYFMDEIQIIPGWEKFARRMADHEEFIYITGSNAKMLSREIYTTLGGRFCPMEISTYDFPEYLTASGFEIPEPDLLSTRQDGQLRRMYGTYKREGGFPEAISLTDKRSYLSAVLQKVILGDIASRNSIRNTNALRILIKKIAETMQNDISYSRLCSILRSVGIPMSKDTVIDYIGYARDAYLLFSIKNYYAKFVERETNSKYYFCDNGFLYLFLNEQSTAFLENLIACHLYKKYGDAVYYLKSAKTGIDIDFYIEQTGTAIQVAEKLDEISASREIQKLLRLKAADPQVRQLLIITDGQEKIIEENGVRIQVLPAYKYLLAL